MSSIACYCRVSMAGQSLNRQRLSNQDYAERQFDAGLADLEIPGDNSTGTNDNI